MIARTLADLVVLVHLTFIGFVALGGLLALRWRWLPWLHLPAVGWGALVEFFGLTCPLTPLENWLRRLAGMQGYSSGFVERYVLPVVYPATLTRKSQVVLGVLLCAVNATVYLLLLSRGVRPRDRSARSRYRPSGQCPAQPARASAREGERCGDHGGEHCSGARNALWVEGRLPVGAPRPEKGQKADAP